MIDPKKIVFFEQPVINKETNQVDPTKKKYMATASITVEMVLAADSPKPATQIKEELSKAIWQHVYGDIYTRLLKSGEHIKADGPDKYKVLCEHIIESLPRILEFTGGRSNIADIVASIKRLPAVKKEDAKQ